MTKKTLISHQVAITFCRNLTDISFCLWAIVSRAFCAFSRRKVSQKYTVTSLASMKLPHRKFIKNEENKTRSSKNPHAMSIAEARRTGAAPKLASRLLRALLSHNQPIYLPVKEPRLGRQIERRARSGGHTQKRLFLFLLRASAAPPCRAAHPS